MKKILNDSLLMVSGFAFFNVIMYLTLGKFWIGGSSFLPLVGKLGPNNKFLFAFLVNVGVMIGAFIGAKVSGEFRLRSPDLSQLPKAILGGFLIGTGITLCPGTCTTAFVTGMPMLSISSVLSATGIFIGAFIVHKITWRS